MDTATLEKIEKITTRYPVRKSALMPVMDMVQRELGGCIPDEELPAIAKAVGVPLAHVRGVQTYYTMYNESAVGKYHVQVDTNIPALLAGAEAVLARLKEALGLEVGETSSDGLFTLTTVEDLASCGTCPVVQVNERYYENMTPEKVDALVASLKQGEMPDWKEETHYASTCNILLKNRGTANARDIAVYKAGGGYAGLDKALTMTPEEVQAEVKDAELRGRGGAGFPAGVKWGFLPKDSGKPVYLICNADEGEPGTFKDRQIMEFDPHLLVEGMAIAGYATGAKLGFIYVRGEFGWIAEILEQATEQAKADNKLGKDIGGRGVEFDIIVHRGAGAYVCGEETALIESLEGNRGQPRLKPPFPAECGLYGCPTVINNVETLACVPHILSEGAAAFKKIGIPNNYGPKVFGVSGHVKRPGVYEYPLGTPLSAVIEAAGGVNGKLKAVIVGGLSAPVLTAAEAADLTLDFDSCAKHGTALGSGGIIVMNDATSIPDIALRTIRFYEHESCGKCIPCREGSTAVESILEKMLNGRGEQSDLDVVLRVCGAVDGLTLCPGGTAWGQAVGAMVLKFRGEFEALVR